MASTLGVDNPFRYRGYFYDEETGLYYLNARYYNPEWGRFINADAYGGSISGLLSHNVFAYCSNNPVMMSDPSGHIAVSIPINGNLRRSPDPVPTGKAKVVKTGIGGLLSNVWDWLTGGSGTGYGGEANNSPNGGVNGVEYNGFVITIYVSADQIPAAIELLGEIHSGMNTATAWLVFVTVVVGAVGGPFAAIPGAIAANVAITNDQVDQIISGLEEYVGSGCGVVIVIIPEFYVEVYPQDWRRMIYEGKI